MRNDRGAATSDVCVAAICSGCLAECEIAISQDAGNTVLGEKSIVREVSHLCALVLSMAGEAVPPHPYTDSVIVDHERLSQAAELAERVIGCSRFVSSPQNGRVYVRPNFQ